MEVAKLTLGDFHIFQENPKVYMSLSERIPGNLFRSQVPPRLARLSRTTKLAHLQCSCRKEIMVEIVLPPEVVHEVFKTYLSTTDILAYSDTAYSDSLATVTLLASPKSFINRVSL